MPVSIFERKGTGIWRTLDVATCPATLYKRRNDSTVEIHAHSIKKKVTFELPSSSTFKDSLRSYNAAHCCHSLNEIWADYTGVLQFHDINDMLRGKVGVLNFDTGRIAFFNAGSTSKAILVSSSSFLSMSLFHSQKHSFSSIVSLLYQLLQSKYSQCFQASELQGILPAGFYSYGLLEGTWLDEHWNKM